MRQFEGGEDNPALQMVKVLSIGVSWDRLLCNDLGSRRDMMATNNKRNDWSRRV